MSDFQMHFQDVNKTYSRNNGLTQHDTEAVREARFSILPGEIVALVGESGCGKTTVARLMAKLIAPTRGKIIYQGQDISAMASRQLRDFRRQVRLIFQSPDASLNPGMTVRMILSEVLQLHGQNDPASISERSETLLTQLGLSGAYLDRYPRELSTGQKKRIGIARAMMIPPELLIADEPLSGIDASHSQQILAFLLQQHQTTGMSIFIISHDIKLVCQIASRILVMNDGQIIEEIVRRDKQDFVPLEDYSKLLFEAQDFSSISRRRDSVSSSLA